MNVFFQLNKEKSLSVGEVGKELGRLWGEADEKTKKARFRPRPAACCRVGPAFGPFGRCLGARRRRPPARAAPGRVPSRRMHRTPFPARLAREREPESRLNSK